MSLEVSYDGIVNGDFPSWSQVKESFGADYALRNLRPWQVDSKLIIGNPSSAAGNIARTHYLLGRPVTHWLLSPSGIVALRCELANQCKGLTVGEHVPVFWPPIICSWKPSSISAETLSTVNVWKTQQTPPLCTRFTLDLDPIKDFTYAPDFEIDWPRVAADVFSIMQRFASPEDETDELGTVIAFEGRFGPNDKAFSAHLVFCDYCQEPQVFNAAVAAELKAYFEPLHLEFDTAPWTSGLKMPFMNKLTKGGARRNKAAGIAWHNWSGDDLTWEFLFSACDPLVVPDIDTYCKVLHFPVTDVHPAKRRLFTNPHASTEPQQAITGRAKDIAAAMVKYYNDQRCAQATVQSSTPKFTSHGNILVRFADRGPNTCQHAGNNHKFVWFTDSDKGVISCLGADSPGTEFVFLDDLKEYGTITEAMDMEIPDDPSGLTDYENFRNWLLACTSDNKTLSPSTPVFRCEFEASDATLPELEAQEHRLLDDNLGSKWLVKLEWFNRLKKDPLLSATDSLACLVQYFNLYMCYITGAKKFFIRSGPRVFMDVEDSSIKIKLGCFQYWHPDAKKPTPFYNVWIKHSLACMPDELKVAHAKHMTLYPDTNHTAFRWAYPDFGGPHCEGVFDNAAPDLRRRVIDWWQQYMIQLTGLTIHENPDTDNAEYRGKCAALLCRWACEVMFRGEPLKMALYVCDELGGAGKTLFWRLIQEMIGRTFVQVPPSLDHFVQDKWKTAYIGCLLVAFDDTMHNTGRDKAAAIYKSTITQDTFQVEFKFGKKVTFDWLGNLFICTNKRFGIPGVTRDERRTLAVVATSTWLGDDECPWTGTADFLGFGWEVLLKNKDQTLSILVGYLYKLFKARFAALDGIAKVVPEFLSDIITGHQRLTENAVAEWIRERWDSIGHFFCPAHATHKHGATTAPTYFIGSWPDDVQTFACNLLQTIPIKTLFNQFKVDSDTKMGSRAFNAQFAKEYAIFMRQRYPAQFSSEQDLVKIVQRQCYSYRAHKTMDEDWEWRQDDKTTSNQRCFKFTYPVRTD